ncbi:MAG: 50S ribosomal protein L9 [Nitrosomonas sp.]|jgi:large subunit ribosomal protein L9|nr:MAG: 50S ribosomal protein L9 [Nitrosomonas sp.]
MQVILMEKIANLGKLGDVVNVKRGYARNYLIPQGKAKWATENAMAEFESKRAELEKNQAATVTEAQALAEKLDGLLIQITQKTGAEGKLFGSVTNANIVEAINAQGFSIDKSMVSMPEGPLKQVGDHPITIVLHSDVSVQITVSILGETTI